MNEAHARRAREFAGPMLAPSQIAAAHSMDTYWFAVDDDGRVAQFDSGDFGAVPFVALDSPIVEEVREYASSPGSRPLVNEVSIRYSPDDDPSNPSTRGLYDYRHDRHEGDFATPYLRLSRPLEPLRVDELPASIRGGCPRFEGARFECDALIQPLDFFAGRANAMIPFLSVREWAMREWDARGRRNSVRLDEMLLELFEIPGRLLRWNVAEAEALLSILDSADRALVEQWRRERALHSAPGNVGSERVRSPFDRDGALLRRDAQRALEEACSNGALPLSWLSDAGDGRRFLAHADEWVDNAMFEDLRDANQMMSLPFLPARVLAKLVENLDATITAERLARDERLARTVYYREARTEDFRSLRALRAQSASERERAIFELGFALDPLISWAAVLWVHTSEPLPLYR